MTEEKPKLNGNILIEMYLQGKTTPEQDKELIDHLLRGMNELITVLKQGVLIRKTGSSDFKDICDSEGVDYIEK